MTWKSRIMAGVAGAGVLAMAADGVKTFEGKENRAYRDPVGIATICYGHTAKVRIGQTLSDEECDRLLDGDLGDALAIVGYRVKVPMPETRRAALGSFVLNVGGPHFSSSTLLKLLNQGQTQAACDQLSRWVYANGQYLPGLAKRRREEREVCLMGLDE